MNIDSKLTNLEREALIRAISKVTNLKWRAAFLKQIDALCARARTGKAFGYYADFDCSLVLRINDLPDDFNKKPLIAEATHPNGEDAIDFVIYTKNGLIDFMEAASTGDWPLNEDQINFCD
jgi:hypothetical protein